MKLDGPYVFFFMFRGWGIRFHFDKEEFYDKEEWPTMEYCAIGSI